MVSDYIDTEDADSPRPYEIAEAVAEWFSEAPNAPDRKMSQRMHTFYSDPLVRVAHDEPSSDAASVMQVAFFERLWHLPNAAITIPQVTTPEYLNNEKDYLRQWVGHDTYEAVLNKIKHA